MNKPKRVRMWCTKCKGSMKVRRTSLGTYHLLHHGCQARLGPGLLTQKRPS